MKEKRIIHIHGKVQGVGFRGFATSRARKLGLHGIIKNLRDETVVYVEVEGEGSVIDDWIRILKEGPPRAEVTKIEQVTKPFTGQLGPFEWQY